MAAVEEEGGCQGATGGELGGAFLDEATERGEPCLALALDLF